MLLQVWRLKMAWGSCSEMCIWKINTPHNAFIMTQYTCVSPIYSNMQVMFEIYCHVCVPQLYLAMVDCFALSEMSLGYIVCFFHLWWFSCGGLTRGESHIPSLGLFAFEIHSSHAHQWLFACLLQIVSHNAAQRQRTEVIFLGLNLP